MTFEGEHKIIPIKGIARAGADSLCEDGAMNEVIGLEYKDGSYVPYAGTITNKSTLPVYENIEEIYIHKTSDGDNVILKIGGLLFWCDKETYDKGFDEDLTDFDEIVTDVEVKDVEFIGNVVCISTDKSIENKIFLDGAYKDWNVNKDDLPHISFRVDLGIAGNEKGAVGVFCADSGNTYSTDTAISLIQKSKGLTTEYGGLTGFFIVCAAYRLKTGEYIKASNPVIMCNPMNKCLGYYYNIKRDNSYFELEGSALIKPSIGDEKTIVYYNHDQLGVTSEIDYILKYEGDIGVNKPLNTLITNYKNSLTGETTNLKSTDAFYPSMSCCAKVGNTTSYSSPIPANKLQYKIDKDIIEDDSLVDGLCIFMSQEIDPYLDFYDKIEKRYHFSSASYDNVDYRMVHGILKSNDKIKKEIEDIQNLYLVSEIKYDEIKASSDWVDVVLKGKLGESLVEQTTLPISAFDNSIIKSALLDSYNSRLHIYNYKQEDVCGYNIEGFNFYGGYGQHDNHLEQYESAYLVVEYKTNDGLSRIVKQFDKPQVSVDSFGYIKLNPYLAYHRGDATNMSIYFQKNKYGTCKEGVFSLKKSFNGGYAFYLDSNINPIGMDNEVYFDTNIKTENTQFKKSYMRVSDTYNPNYFPPANTYTIGNGSIIGIASLSISLSQDTFGQYPLLVFCTDGIYSMGVDTTGAGVYNNIAPFSREVCVNRNTICEIDGTVLFASSKGLMIATAQGVQEFVPSLNGEPKHLPQDDKTTKGLGLALYKEAINHELAVQLTGCISSEDFIDFLKDGNTIVSYASEKNNIVVYNPSKPYTYWIDIPTRNVTKLPVGIRMDNNNYPNEEYVTAENRIMMFKHLSSEGDVQCMLQSRPIKVDGRMKSYMRVVARGYFNSLSASNFAVILVLGSYDGINWQPLGNKQKKIGGGFHDLGCVVDRVSCEYIMVIVSGSLTPDSHIDGIELTKINKYNNKLK